MLYSLLQSVIVSLVSCYSQLQWVFHIIVLFCFPFAFIVLFFFLVCSVFPVTFCKMFLCSSIRPRNTWNGKVPQSCFKLNPVSRCISEDSSEASQPLKGHPYHLFVLFFISIYRYVLFLVCFMFLFSKKWETYFVMTFLKHKIYNV